MSNEMRLIGALSALVAEREGEITKAQSEAICKESDLDYEEVKGYAIGVCVQFVEDCRTPGTERNKKWGSRI